MACANPGNYVTLPGSWGGGSELTVLCWARSVEDVNAFQCMIATTETSPTRFSHLQFGPSSGGGNNVVYQEPAGFVNIPLPLDVEGENVWRHYAITSKSGDSRFFRDGTQVGSTDTTTYSTLTSSSNGRLAAGYGGGRLLVGDLYGAAIFNTWLAPATIATIAASASASAYATNVLAASPQGFWKLDEAAGSGGTAADISGFARHGTFVSGHRQTAGPLGDPATRFAVCGGTPLRLRQRGDNLNSPRLPRFHDSRQTTARLGAGSYY